MTTRRDAKLYLTHKRNRLLRISPAFKALDQAGGTALGSAALNAPITTTDAVSERREYFVRFSAPVTAGQLSFGPSGDVSPLKAAAANETISLGYLSTGLVWDIQSAIAGTAEFGVKDRSGRFFVLANATWS